VRFASLAERSLVVMQAEMRAEGGALQLADGIPLPATADAVEAVDACANDGRVMGEVRGRKGGAFSFAISTKEQRGAVERIGAIVPLVRHRPPEGPANRALEQGQRVGVTALLARHRKAWRRRWRDADVVVEGDPHAQRALRFALYHLISAGDPESDLASIGARGLSGSGYRGHVFWDTDVFMIPFFVYTHPATARALLAYRYRTLPAARARAERVRCRGALFAWESADTGEDCTPPQNVAPDGRLIPVFTGEQAHHISADVAWAVSEYWRATGDDDFLLEMGAEIILETARFWSSRARKGRDGHFHIARVVGPDEYHEGVRDNAFTNVTARWNLERALELAAILEDLHPMEWNALRKRLGLARSELHRWQLVADRLVDSFNPETLLYEQFAGFFGLEDVVSSDVAPRPFAGEVVFGWSRMRRAQIIKQADVVMLVHMLRDEIATEVAAANYRYYEPRTTHGSSLSPAIHAAVAARVGLLEDALAYFRMAAAIDLSGNGRSAEGIHMATAGGLWQAAVTGFGGIAHDRDLLALDPRLPPGWQRLSFPIQSRGTSVSIEVSRESLTVTLNRPETISLGGKPGSRLAAGRHLARRTKQGWSALERVDA
jgi:kojibiose phosphorylase